VDFVDVARCQTQRHDGDTFYKQLSDDNKVKPDLEKMQLF